MHRYATLLIAALAALSASAVDVVAPRPDPRPVALVAGLEDGPLKRELAACTDDPVRRTSFSLGHRGAPLHYPEHTRESYVAAAAMGAGVIECDVTFTRDKQLVCRHAQDDLHTTTDILLTPLAARCKQPFRPARFDAQGALLAPAAAECRTSDITLAEFRTLRGKRDGFEPRARTVEDYVWGGKAAPDPLGPGTGLLLSHAESIALFRQLGVQMVPELKQPVVTMPYDGMSQQQFAQRLIDDYRTAGVPPGAVWPQSFNLADILYWIEREPEFGRQAVYLEDAESAAELPVAAEFERLHAQGVRIWAPPLFALLALDDSGAIVPSPSARDARAAGLELVTWSLERSGTLGAGQNGWYYQTIDAALHRDSDVLPVLDVLARQVGVRAVFSDWPATTTFYANCTGLD
ncbi:MAG: glycerophosphodiester phosphodiesterase [Proteobacteria bacterium]|nr:glycerophosphodiester phosphodiesterase [Pseudomonadota bacterium]